MSVLACDRNGCKNIMCDRYSNTYGYICDECFTELVNLGPEIATAAFMNTKKGSVCAKQAALARFNVEFPLRS